VDSIQDGLPDQIPVCAIGASAGGVGALKRLFESLEADSGLAFVVILHLDPTQESQLTEILSSCTRMGVQEVHGAVPLRPDQVYVIPPDCELVIRRDDIEARPFSEPRGQRAPIDIFFRSLAAGRGDGIAVIMSGAGSDGTVGVRAVKEAGGVVFVQDPSDAEFPSMPHSAVATGVADFVLPTAELGGRIVEVARHKQALRDLDAASAEEEMRQILSFLRGRTGHDFSSYKRTTVVRRIGRRMQVTRQASLGDYIDYLGSNREEANELFSDLLISVTSFFRDPQAFERLAEKVVAPLFDRKGEEEEIRVWVAGCATGEETYSLAILFLEEAARRRSQAKITIFATDLDEGALATGREARYPASIVADVSAERLAHFFVDEGLHYRLRKEVRELVLFASHSALKDPPFLRIDLLSCRNLLIYLERDLQRQMMEIFHYATAPDGFLFLGSAETVDTASELFRTLDREARIYRSDPQAPRTLPMPAHTVADRPRMHGAPARPPRPDDTTGAAAAGHAVALEGLAPPSILVDENHRVMHLSETAGRYLLPSKGTLSAELDALLRPELRLDARSALHRVFERGEPSLTPPVAVAFNGKRRRVGLYAAPRAHGEGAAGRALVVFLEGEEIDLDEPERDEGGSAVSSLQVRRLHEELHHAHERLSGSRREHEAALQELRAANEELQSVNEEYRSTAEELETSKEELQSINEELQTVNAELKSKLRSISVAHSDLQNLIAATDISTLFLDPELRIKLFTPAVARLFNVTEADIGRAITDFTHNLKYDGIEAEAKAVLGDLAPREREVASKEGRWLMVRLRPYRTLDERIDGIVITFVDVTERLATEASLREARDLLTMATASAHQGWGTWDLRDGSMSWDERGHEILGLPAGADRQEDWLARLHPEDRAAVESEFERCTETGDPFEMTYRVLTGESDLRHVHGTAAFERDETGRPLRATGLVRDVTERKTYEESQRLLVAELNHRVKNMLAVVSSIAAQTQRTTATPEAFVEAFQQRVQALAGAHNLLTERLWSGAQLEEVIRSTLATFAEDDRDRLKLKGPNVVLSANATITLTMAFHELGTNAMKYGALSNDRGTVEIEWWTTGDADTAELAVEWRERGGPVVAPPQHGGFGSRLLERGVAAELRGRVSLSYDKEGLTCRMAFPIDKAIRRA